jgi:hypothetical protein
MPFVDNVNQYPVVDKYWGLVKRTLCDVFQEKADSADTLRKEVSQRPADEQLQFYHAEPLDVAADLAGKRSDKGQVKEYRKLADQCDWR